jgi:biopolymer transport protein ExbB/TolQ
MSELAILGLSMSGVVIVTGIVLYFLQNRQFRESHQELKMFQLENTRIIQQLSKSTQRLSETMEQLSREAAMRHEENMSYFHGIMQSIARIIRKQEEGEGEGAK